MESTLETMVCAIDSNRGIYAPQSFVEQYKDDLVGASQEDIDIILDGPDNELYWDAWNDLETSAKVTMYSWSFVHGSIPNGELWSIYCDGDIFLVSPNHAWDD